MQQTVHAGLLFDLKARYEALQSAFKKEAGRLPDAERLITEARRAIARTAIRHVYQSIKCGLELEEPLDAFQQFAIALDPGVVTTKGWRALERIRRRHQGRLRALLARQIARLEIVLTGISGGDREFITRFSENLIKDRSNVYSVEDCEADLQVHMRVGSG
jgi:hypothetical protein